jgi:hypothetical protein
MRGDEMTVVDGCFVRETEGTGGASDGKCRWRSQMNQKQKKNWKTVVVSMMKMSRADR